MPPDPTSQTGRFMVGGAGYMESESPEQLDNLINLRSMPFWLAKVAIVVLFLMALTWSFFGSIKDMVPGQGIFVRELENVQTMTDGTLLDLYVAEGDFVSPGQVVGRISQGRSEMEMQGLRSKLKLKLESHNLRAAKEQQVRERVLNSIYKRIANLELMQVIAQRNYQNSVELEAKRIITRLELQDLRSKEADIRKQMAEAEAERAKAISLFLERRELSGPAESHETPFAQLPVSAQELILESRRLRDLVRSSPWMGLDPSEITQLSTDERIFREKEEALTRQIRASLARDFEDLSRTEAGAQTQTLQREREKVRAELQRIDAMKYSEKALERVVEILDLESQATVQELQQIRYGLVRSRHRGRVVEVRYEVGEILPAGANVVGVERQDQLRVRAFMPAKQAKGVTLAMPVQISPSTVKREEFGFLKGVVEGVASYPATPERMERLLRNKVLVERINKDGSPLEVDVVLRQRPNGRYFWAFGEGPQLDPTAGTVCQVMVQTGESAPITRVLPFLKRFLRKSPPELEEPHTGVRLSDPALEDGPLFEDPAFAPADPPPGLDDVAPADGAPAVLPPGDRAEEAEGVEMLPASGTRRPGDEMPRPPR